jgi:putative intracellular protease/amidase
MSIEENKVVFITAKKGRVLLSVALLLLLLVSCASQQPKEKGPQVLLILREHLGSADEQYMVTNEAVAMKSMLEEADFKVVIASASVRTFVFVRGDITLEPNLRLAEVNVADYAGFIIHCMALGTSSVKPEEVAIAKQIVAKGKPVAAQRKGVVILAEAGVLAGKRYSYESNPTPNTLFDEAIYSGKGVVQDGNIITSAYCPYHGSLDQTVELTQALIAGLQE